VTWGSPLNVATPPWAADEAVEDVTGYGAVADFSKDCLPAARAAAAKITARSGVLRFPPPATQPRDGTGALVATPLYRLSAGNFLESLGAGSGAPGGLTDVGYRLGLNSGPLLLPQGHRLVGRGSATLNDSTPVGSEIRALAGFTRRLELVSLTGDGTTVTVAAKGHDLKVGESFTVANVSQSGFNGTFTVGAVTDSEAFTYLAAGTGTATPTAGNTITVTTTVRPRVVQLLPSNSLSADSTGVETLTINGRDIAGCIGVWSDCLQENCGVDRVNILGCHTGVKIVSAKNITAANFTLPAVSALMSGTAGNQGPGFDIYATKYVIPKATVILITAGRTLPAAYRLRGQDVQALDLHFEGADYGLIIGGASTGVGGDNGVQDALFKIHALHGYNRATQPGLIAAAYIDPVSTNIFGVDIGTVSINQHNPGPLWASGQNPAVGERRGLAGSTAVQVELVTQGTGTTTGSEPPAAAVGAANYTDANGWEWKYVHLCALVIDPVNGVVLPSKSSTGYRHITYYRFAGTLGVDSGNAVKRPVYTSYYDGVAPGGAVIARAAANTVNRSFVGGAVADVVQINGSTELRMLSNAYPGAVVYLDVQSGGPTIKHLTGSSATLQFYCDGGADITGATGLYRAIYGDSRGGADKWFVAAAGAAWADPPPPASGSFTVKAATINVPYGVTRARVTVVDAAVSSSNRILIQAAGPLDADANDPEMDAVTFTAIAGTGSFDVIATSATGRIGGPFRLHYTVG
jgi:hypothetical protein